MSDQLMALIVFVVYALGLLAGLACVAYWQGKWKAENVWREGHYGYIEALEYEKSGRVLAAVLWPLTLTAGVTIYFVWEAGAAAWNKMEELGRRSNESRSDADTPSDTN